jgi:hypothetical protein
MNKLTFKQIIREEIKNLLEGTTSTTYPYEIIKSSDKAIYIKYPVFSPTTKKQEYKETWMPKSIVDKNLVNWFLDKNLKDINDKRRSFAISKGNYNIKDLRIGNPPQVEYKPNIKIFLDQNHPLSKIYGWKELQDSNWYLMDLINGNPKLKPIKPHPKKIKNVIDEGYDNLILIKDPSSGGIVLTNIPLKDIYEIILNNGKWFNLNFPSQYELGRSRGATPERDLLRIKEDIKILPSSNIKFIDVNKKQ